MSGALYDDGGCRVYWGLGGCDLRRGHSGDHEDQHGNRYNAHGAILFGEDLTAEERAALWDEWGEGLPQRT